MGRACSTYGGRGGVYRILVWKPERKRPPDITQLVASMPQVTIFKLVSKVHCFNVTFLAVKVKKVQGVWRHGSNHSSAWHRMGGVESPRLSTQLLDSKKIFR